MVSSSSSHWNVTCFRHDIAEQISPDNDIEFSFVVVSGYSGFYLYNWHICYCLPVWVGKVLCSFLAHSLGQLHHCHTACVHHIRPTYWSWRVHVSHVCVTWLRSHFHGLLNVLIVIQPRLLYLVHTLIM